MRTLVIGVACMLGLPSAGWAQPAEGGVVPVVGSDVRITRESGQAPLRGLLVGIEDEGLTVSVGGSPLLIPRSEIVQVEVKTGQRRHAGAGALIGGLAGLVGSLIEPRYTSGGEPCVLNKPCSRSVSAWLGLMGGAMGGALVGMFIRSDVWAPATIDVAFSIAPPPRSAGRGLAIGGVLRF